VIAYDARTDKGTDYWDFDGYEEIDYSGRYGIKGYGNF
jgi:hypothetical protein